MFNEAEELGTAVEAPRCELVVNAAIKWQNWELQHPSLSCFIAHTPQ